MFTFTNTIILYFYVKLQPNYGHRFNLQHCGGLQLQLYCFDLVQERQGIKKQCKGSEIDRWGVSFVPCRMPDLVSGKPELHLTKTEKVWMNRIFLVRCDSQVRFHTLLFIIKCRRCIMRSLCPSVRPSVCTHSCV